MFSQQKSGDAAAFSGVQWIWRLCTLSKAFLNQSVFLVPLVPCFLSHAIMSRDPLLKRCAMHCYFLLLPLCLPLSGPLPARDRVWGLLCKAGAQVVIPHRSHGSCSPTASCSRRSAPSKPPLPPPSSPPSVSPLLMCLSGGISCTVRCSARCEDATRCLSKSPLTTQWKMMRRCEGRRFSSLTQTVGNNGLSRLPRSKCRSVVLLSETAQDAFFMNVWRFL